jgi:hypothetical protein
MTIIRSWPRWRVLAAIAIACSAALVPAVAQAASASHAHPATPARPQTAECASGNTYVWLALAANGALGTIYYPVEFTNTGSHSCWLEGFPGVSAVTGSGRALGPAAGRFSATPHRVTLKPNQTAHAALGIIDVGGGTIAGCHLATAGGLAVYAPNQRRRQLVLNFSFRACKNKVYMHVYPVTSGIGVP